MGAGMISHHHCLVLLPGHLIRRPWALRCLMALSLVPVFLLAVVPLQVLEALRCGATDGQLSVLCVLSMRSETGGCVFYELMVVVWSP